MLKCMGRSHREPARGLIRSGARINCGQSEGAPQGLSELYGELRESSNLQIYSDLREEPLLSLSLVYVAPIFPHSSSSLLQ